MHKIVIKASKILEQSDSTLRLEYPATCSRCERTPADYYETHNLKLRAGLKHNPLPGQRYRLERNYKVRIRICERCYQQNYLEAADTLAGDNNKLGRLSTTQNFLRMLGAISAALGLLLLTPFVPNSGFLAVLKTGWWVSVTAGLVLVITAVLSQMSARSSLQKALIDAQIFDRELVRAEVRTPLFADPNDLDQVALEIRMNNEAWASECAAHYHFDFEEIKS